MKVTPLDIRRKEFKRSLRGYDDEEVDVFLDEVADEFERLYQENAEMQDRLQRLEDQVASHAQLKEALEKALVSAQVQAEQVTSNARKESELIMRDAELKARDIVNESYSETQRVQQSLVQLKHLEEDFRFKFRSLLEAHLKFLNDAPIIVAVPEAPVVGTEAGTPSAEPATAERVPLESEPAGAVPDKETGASDIDAGGEVDTDSADDIQRPLPHPERTITYRRVRADDASDLTAAEPSEAQPEKRRAFVWPTDDDDANAPGRAAPAFAPLLAPDGDVPTEETEWSALEESDGRASPDTTASDKDGREDPYRDGSEERQPTRGFFFGRQVDDLDDSFVTSETLGGDKLVRDHTEDRDGVDDAVDGDADEEKGRDFAW